MKSSQLLMDRCEFKLKSSDWHDPLLVVMKKITALIFLTILSPAHGANELRAHEGNISCEQIAAKEEALGSVIFRYEEQASGHHAFQFMENNIKGGVQYLCHGDEVIESRQVFFPGSFDESIVFFESRLKRFETRFGKPCHDYRIAPSEYVKRAFDEGMDIEGLIRLDWHLEKGVTFPKVLTLSIHGKDPEINSWLVTAVVAPGGITAIHADGRIERTPPTACDE